MMNGLSAAITKKNAGVYESMYGNSDVPPAFVDKYSNVAHEGGHLNKDYLDQTVKQNDSLMSTDIANKQRSEELHASLKDAERGNRLTTSLNKTLAQRIETDSQAMAQKNLAHYIGDIAYTRQNAGGEGGKYLNEMGRIMDDPETAETFLRHIKNSQMA